MVGQMQGKFWLEVMAGRGVGHLVHEVRRLLAIDAYSYVNVKLGRSNETGRDSGRLLEAQ
jgi:hypothetical protein